MKRKAKSDAASWDASIEPPLPASPAVEPLPVAGPSKHRGRAPAVRPVETPAPPNETLSTEIEVMDAAPEVSMKPKPKPRQRKRVMATAEAPSAIESIYTAAGSSECEAGPSTRPAAAPKSKPKPARGRKERQSTVSAKALTSQTTGGVSSVETDPSLSETQRETSQGGPVSARRTRRRPRKQPNVNELVDDNAAQPPQSKRRKVAKDCEVCDGQEVGSGVQTADNQVISSKLEVCLFSTGINSVLIMCYYRRVPTRLSNVMAGSWRLNLSLSYADLPDIKAWPDLTHLLN